MRSAVTTLALAASLSMLTACAGSTQALPLRSGAPDTHLAGTQGRHVTNPGAADGHIAGDDVDAFDTDQPAIKNLDPALLAALQRATRDAARRGITITVTSGWRSRAYQQHLLDEAVEKYGSLSEAEKWVATPDASAHTHGKAVDVGPTEAEHWLSEYGAAYGLCQTYGNEIWHYQLEVVPGGTCPAPQADAAE